MILPLSPDVVRRWCEQIARLHPVQHIEPFGVPYLERYFLSGYTPYKRQYPAPTASLFLHHFVDSDPNDQLHDHPWHYALSLVLVNGYREFRCDAHGHEEVRFFLPGDVNVLQPGDRHRIDLIADDCWTLFAAGDYAHPWQFFDDCRSAVRTVS